MNHGNNFSDLGSKEHNASKNVQKSKSSHRIKERMISDAVDVVFRWRKLSDKNGDKKLTLKQGADIIGVAKKSLDDYLLQFRLGMKYGFNFAKHSESKIGVLRTFNKKMKKVYNQGNFMAGRKRKQDEEDYTKIINDIMMKIHGPKVEECLSIDESVAKQIKPLSAKTSETNLSRFVPEGSGSEIFENTEPRNNDLFKSPNSEFDFKFAPKVNTDLSFGPVPNGYKEVIEKFDDDHIHVSLNDLEGSMSISEMENPFFMLDDATLA